MSIKVTIDFDSAEGVSFCQIYGEEILPVSNGLEIWHPRKLMLLAIKDEIDKLLKDRE